MDLKKILLERFEKKGVEPVLIPGLLKNIMATLRGRPDIAHEEVSERLHYIGWNDFDLDENTLQIIIADYESSAPTPRLGPRPSSVSPRSGWGPLGREVVEGSP